GAGVDQRRGADLMRAGGVHGQETGRRQRPYERQVDQLADARGAHHGATAATARAARSALDSLRSRWSKSPRRWLAVSVAYAVGVSELSRYRRTPKPRSIGTPW